MIMFDTKNGSIPVFPTALPALPFPRQRQRLEGTGRGALGWLVQSSAGTPDHIAVITASEEAELREVGVLRTDQLGSI